MDRHIRHPTLRRGERVCAADARDLDKYLQSAGKKKGDLLHEDYYHYEELSGVGHDETAWQSRVEPMLQFLLGSQTASSSAKSSTLSDRSLTKKISAYSAKDLGQANIIRGPEILRSTSG